MNDHQDDVAVRVKSVSKYFEPSKGQGSIKQAFTGALKKQRKTKNKSKGYWALKDIDFEVMRGEFFGIVGKNGSGKSTLLKIIAGVYNPTKGDVEVNGKLVPFIELGVGFNPELNGRDNVFLNGALLGFNRNEMTAMYEEIVAFAELEEHMEVKLKNFSSGMQVRLAFSIAIRAKADILLIDEVLAVGDAAFQQKCYTYFEKIKNEKRTVIFVSHDMAAMRRFCSRAIYIQDGEQVFTGEPSDIADIYTERNIDTVNEENEGGVSFEGFSLSSKISSLEDGGINFKLKYESKNNENVYVGISILKDGVSIAEINTLDLAVLKRKGSLSYILNAGILNSGAYLFNAALFRVNSREIVATAKTRHFTIKGDDVNRGGALKLSNNWVEN